MTILLLSRQLSDLVAKMTTSTAVTSIPPNQHDHDGHYQQPFRSNKTTPNKDRLKRFPSFRRTPSSIRHLFAKLIDRQNRNAQDGQDVSGRFSSSGSDAGHHDTSNKQEQNGNNGDGIWPGRAVFVNSFANKLNMMVREPSSLPNADAALVHCLEKHAPRISAYGVTDFIERVICGTNNYVEEPTFAVDSTGIRCAIIALAYLERARLVVSDKEYLPSVFLIAFLLAFKVTDDYLIETSWWAFLLGCQERMINDMEVVLCDILHWDLSMPDELYAAEERSLFLARGNERS